MSTKQAVMLNKITGVHLKIMHIYLENSDGMLKILFINSETILRTRPRRHCKEDLETGISTKLPFHGNKGNINNAHHVRSNVQKTLQFLQ